jgi:cytochrome bd-type quinol oxidase subunit 1
MTVLELSRWQFGITTVYHFIFVPLANPDAAMPSTSV